MESTGGWNGYAIPAGQYRLSAALDDAVRHACAAPARQAGEAHPIFAIVAAIGGMGKRIGDVCRELGLAFDSGAVLGRCRVDYTRPLNVDADYAVDARVLRLERKASRRFGAADHLTLEMTVSAGHAPCTRLELTTIIPAPVA